MHIKAQDLGFTYMKNTPFEKRALRGVNLELKEGSRVAIVGHTGSGKSTLVQHINGLLVPSEGSLTAGEVEIRPGTKQKTLAKLRQQVGMVFQFPEHQLFDETVEKDVAFGPLNFGYSREEAFRLACEALGKVGLHDKELYQKSPFDLSGGQMRRVAIAGVLASNPDVLILDEPTAGLDPQGRINMMELFSDWQKEKQERSYVLVTHHMEDAATYADYIFVMHKGSLVFEGSPEEVFSDEARLKQWGLGVPKSSSLLMNLSKRTGAPLTVTAFTPEDAALEIARFLKGDEGSV
ncbi:MULTISPECIES: energy-coupling factor transporter ATPase [Alteribacter]|uniref:Energy-coupling factor transporter ATP-binding protein EcfA2 n=1 Tax=Alteribacter keqinensis TaxID=2483800 RepID=A0A3M7TKW7_9BACI|nr:MULTISPECIES: energy-coupling factor transporter ATPase [Alteribacter]MBM7096647.1 energy-coupling factor transporter ATPase [Alteribacter salitolerans]RNA66198.1 energy-coupling factor transporter ATPase [Alteribacter keqinensis]